MSYIKIILFFSTLSMIVSQPIYASHEKSNAAGIMGMGYGLNLVYTSATMDDEKAQESQNTVIRLTELRERKNALMKSLHNLIKRLHAGETKAQYQIAVQISLCKKTLKELGDVYEQLQTTMNSSAVNETGLEYRKQQCAQDWNELQIFLDSINANSTPCEQIAIDIAPTLPNQVPEIQLSPLDITTIAESPEEKDDAPEEQKNNTQNQAQTDNEMITPLSSVKNNINRYNIAMREKFVGREMQLQSIKTKQQVTTHKGTGVRPLNHTPNQNSIPSHGRIASLHNSEAPRYCTAQRALCSLVTLVLMGLTGTVIYYTCVA